MGNKYTIRRMKALSRGNCRSKLGKKDNNDANKRNSVMRGNYQRP